MIKLTKFLSILLSLGTTLFLSGCSNVIMLNPQGSIATDEKQLLITAVLLMLIIVVPVIILTFVIARKFRASNTKAKYAPDWGHSTIIEMVCWSVPCIIILILAAITLVTTRTLDPYKPLDVKGKPLTVQVVALNWRWLFIYPEQKIATINFLQIPVNRPIKFLITADAPMNSFQIPQLGSQIYAMPGMQTKLHLIANKPGDYYGFSANYSGHGFSNMNFTARAGSEEDFNKWVKSVRQSKNKLTAESYKTLVPDSEDNKVQYFASVPNTLFNDIMMKFMMPMNGHTTMQHESHNTGN